MDTSSRHAPSSSSPHKLPRKPCSSLALISPLSGPLSSPSPSTRPGAGRLPFYSRRRNSRRALSSRLAKEGRASRRHVKEEEVEDEEEKEEEDEEKEEEEEDEVENEKDDEDDEEDEE